MLGRRHISKPGGRPRGVGVVGFIANRDVTSRGYRSGGRDLHTQPRDAVAGVICSHTARNGEDVGQAVVVNRAYIDGCDGHSRNRITARH